MSDPKLTDVSDIDLNKEVSFTYPDGFLEAAAILDFLPDDEAKINLIRRLSASIG